MNKDQLLALGLTEEQATQVLQGLETTQMIPKSRFDEVNNAKKALEEQVNDFSNQLKTLQGAVKGNEELEATVKSLQEAQANTKAEYEQKLKDSKIDAAIKLSLAGKVHDEDLIVGLIDRTNIQVDDNYNVVKGLDDQLEALKGSKSFLFKETAPEQQQQQQPTLHGVKPQGIDAPPATNLSFGAQLAQQRSQTQQKSALDPWAQNTGGIL